MKFFPYITMSSTYLFIYTTQKFAFFKQYSEREFKVEIRLKFNDSGLELELTYASLKINTSAAF